MYKEIKKKIGHIASVETHFSHAQPFLCIRSSVSQRKLPAMDDNGAHKTHPKPQPWSAARPGWLRAWGPAGWLLQPEEPTGFPVLC